MQSVPRIRWQLVLHNAASAEHAAYEGRRIDPISVGFLVLVIFVAAAAAGVTGFGFVLLSAPFLTLLFEPRIVVVLTLVLGWLSLVLLLLDRRVRSSIDRRLVGWLTLGALPSIPLGAVVLAQTNPTDLRVVINGVVIISAGLLLVRLPHRRLPRPAITLAGLVGGFLSTSTGLSGPPAGLVAATMALEKDAFRASLAAYLLLIGLPSGLTFLAGGLLTGPIVGLILISSPALFLGLLAGKRLFGLLSSAQFRQGILLCLILASVLGIWLAAR
ncbi:MAG: sulfite exporter TauE/SafE family protein [Chloroflexi bacterium]|nr:sulfite exporter TauE/SafE family protein [Chloroflexota bacterium]